MARRSVRMLVAVGSLAVALPVVSLPATAVATSPQAAGAAVVPASRADGAPTGWRVVPQAHGVRVVWRSRQPVPLRDAAVEFRLGGTLLGLPRPGRDGRSYVLEHDGPLPGLAADLTVSAGGLPLDADGRPVLPAARTGPAPTRGDARVVARRAAVDPGVPGPYATARADYDLGGAALGGFPEPTEVVGAVVSPVGAPGPRPLVLFLHGRHSTCFKGGPDGRSSIDWPCRPGWTPIPSHLGYLDAQELLASQGYLTVSVSANGINAQDWEAGDGGAAARSQLVRHHLRLWRQWGTTGGAPFGDAFVDRVDLDRVLLVGHSRGGEGVNRAAIDTRPRNPWRIAGQVLIGPTAFGRQTAVGVDTTVLLPACDGDVSDLQGQQYVDQARDLLPADRPDPAVRSAVLVMGANHNYFNREWTPGESAAPSWDDWSSRRDAACGTRARLSPTEQRTVGATYVATSAAAFVDRLPGALPLLNGTAARPASIGDATTYVSALGGRRSPVYRPSDDVAPPRATGADATVCEGYRTASALPVCVRSGRTIQPHFLPMYDLFGLPAPQALRVSWDRAGGRVSVPVEASVDVGGAAALELRVAVAAGTAPARFAVEAVDGDGVVHRLGTRRLSPVPGGYGAVEVWGQTVRVPLPHGAQPPLPGLRALRIVPLSARGSLVLLDVAARRPGWSTAPVPTLPRVDVVSRRIVEGDTGERTEQVRVEVTGPADGTEQLWVQPPDPEYLGLPGFAVTLAPGQSVIEVPLVVSADDRDDYDLESAVVVKAMRGVVTGRYRGRVLIADDDPEPVLTAERYWVSAAEGRRLRWDLGLSAPSDKWIWVGLEPTPPAAGAELSLSDLPVRYRKRLGLPTGDREVPLSRTRLYLGTEFQPGQTTAVLSLPTRLDDVVEPVEQVVLGTDEDLDVRFRRVLTGRVLDG